LDDSCYLILAKKSILSKIQTNVQEKNIILKLIFAKMGLVAIGVTAWSVCATAIASKGISAAVASSNYVTRYLCSVDRTDKVLQVRIRSCWLGHGFYSSLGSAFTGSLTGNSLTHWWAEISTERGWYCAQLNIGGLYLHKHSTQRDVDLCGLSQGSNDSSGNITTKKTYRPSNRTMG